MSAGDRLAAATIARLDGNEALEPLRVYDWPPERAGVPYAQIEDPVLRADDGAGVTGRVGTLAIALRDGGERPARLRLLMARVEEQMAALDPDLGGDGWRLAGIALARTRLARVREGWVGRLEWSVRLYRVN